MRRLSRSVSGMMSRLPNILHRHVSETSRAQLTGVVEVIYMDGADRVDWRELSVAARPTLQRCDGSHGARHAGRPVDMSRLSRGNERKCAKSVGLVVVQELAPATSPCLFLALTCEFEDGDARRDLASLRPVGIMQGRCAASGLQTSGTTFLVERISGYVP